MINREDLLNLISQTLRHEPQPARGGHLFCHTPHVADFAYLGRVYDPISPSVATEWFNDSGAAPNAYFGFLTKAANGLRLMNISLRGVIGALDRSVGFHTGQPISLDYGNRFERPPGLAGTDIVIGGLVGWSSKGDYVMNADGAVRLVSTFDGEDVADQWPSLEAMLRAEVRRVAGLHDSSGQLLGSHTALMHPNGRRWETETEPGSSSH